MSTRSQVSSSSPSDSSMRLSGTASTRSVMLIYVCISLSEFTVSLTRDKSYSRMLSAIMISCVKPIVNRPLFVISILTASGVSISSATSFNMDYFDFLINSSNLSPPLATSLAKSILTTSSAFSCCVSDASGTCSGISSGTTSSGGTTINRILYLVVVSTPIF